MRTTEMRYFDWTLDQWSMAAAWYAQRRPLPPTTAEGMLTIRKLWDELRVDQPGAIIEMESGKKAALSDMRWAAEAMRSAMMSIYPPKERA